MLHGCNTKGLNHDTRFMGGADGQRGQFVTRYYVKTLINSYYPHGLCLDGGVPAWSVSAEGMQQVIEFIEGATA